MSEISRYDPIEGVLAQLRERYQGVQFDVQHKDGLAAAKEAKRSLTKLRTGLEGLRKDEKAEHLERGRKIDGEAKRIEGEIRALEEPIAGQIEAEERRVEELRQAQAKRDAVAKAKLEQIQAEPRYYVGKTSEQMTARMNCFLPPLETDFAGSCIAWADARKAYDAVMAEIHLLIDEAEAAEARDRQRKAEEEALANMRREMEEKQRLLDQQAAEIEANKRAMAEQQARNERAAQQALGDGTPAERGFKLRPGKIVPDDAWPGQPVNTQGNFYAEDGTFMEAPGRRSIFDDVDEGGAPEVLGFDLAAEPDQHAEMRVATEPAGFDDVKVPPSRVERYRTMTSSAMGAVKPQDPAGFEDDADPFGNGGKAQRRADVPDTQTALQEIYDLTHKLRSPLGMQVAAIAAKALGLN